MGRGGALREDPDPEAVDYSQAGTVLAVGVRAACVGFDGWWLWKYVVSRPATTVLQRWSSNHIIIL